MQDNTSEIKQRIEKFKQKVLEKFEDYIQGIALLPPNEKEKNKLNVLVMLDDAGSTKNTPEQLKEKLSKVIEEIAKGISKDLKPRVTLNSELIQNSYDGKHELSTAIAQGAIIHDTGLMSAIKVTTVHKSMILERFEKYIVSYVLAGSITTGKARKDSDIDAFVVIDDTDVKKMTRVELKDKLRGIISQMTGDAKKATGINRDFHVQVYILTDFWDNIKDASPTIFTFLRDGIPLYDRGVFMPWKNLLRMGKIKPSPEAIEIMMSSGEQFLQRVDAKLKEIGMEDFFWATITTSQAAIMMYGLPPPTPKETPVLLRDLFVKKEKIFADKDVKILEKILKVRKDLEHGHMSKIDGKQIDQLHQDSKNYLKNLQVLFEKIELKSTKDTTKTTFENLNGLIHQLKTEDSLESTEPKTLLAELVKKGYLAQSTVKTYESILKDMEKHSKDKLTKKELDKTIGTARSLTKLLLEVLQRKKVLDMEKAKAVISTKNKVGEALFLESGIIYTPNYEESETKHYIELGKTKYKKPMKIDAKKLKKLVNDNKATGKVSINSELYKAIEKIAKEPINIELN